MADSGISFSEAQNPLSIPAVLFNRFKSGGKFIIKSSKSLIFFDKNVDKIYKITEYQVVSRLEYRVGRALGTRR